MEQALLHWGYPHGVYSRRYGNQPMALLYLQSSVDTLGTSLLRPKIVIGRNDALAAGGAF